MKPAYFLALALLTPALLSADVSKYKDWGSSPQAYFMTKAEREQWAAIKTDSDAEQFIKAFVAARKPDFVAEVTKRTEMADKYLTVGKNAGSKTLRGRVIIMFGPPSAFDVSKRVGGSEHLMGRDSYMSAGGGASSGPGSGGGQSPSDVVSAVNHAEMSGKEIRTFTINYDGDKLPRPRAASLNVAIEVDSNTGHEELLDKKLMPELEELFEAAVGTWLVKK